MISRLNSSQTVRIRGRNRRGRRGTTGNIEVIRQFEKNGTSINYQSSRSQVVQTSGSGSVLTRQRLRSRIGNVREASKSELVQSLFQDSINDVEGGRKFLKRLRDNGYDDEIFGLKRYVGVHGNARGVIAGAIQRDGFIDVKLLDNDPNFGYYLDRSDRMHNDGFQDFYTLALEAQGEIDLGGYSPHQITIQEGNGLVQGSRIFHKDDLLAVVQHRGDLEIISKGGGDNIITIA